MKLSFCYISNRPGSIDMLAASMASQICSFGPVDYELIVIDGYPGRVERGVAEKYLRDLGINVRHYGIPKAKTFPWSRTGFTNAMNTAVMYATGEWCVFLHDFTTLPISAYSNICELIETRHGGPDSNVLISGVAIVYESLPPVADDDIQSNLGGPWVPREPWVPEVFEVGYWAAPTRFFEITNGIDERADFCSEWALDCVMTQAKIHGYDLRLERAMIHHALDHRKWHTGGVSESSKYRTFGGFLGNNVADIPEKPEWSYWSANPYNMAMIRKSLQGK